MSDDNIYDLNKAREDQKSKKKKEARSRKGGRGFWAWIQFFLVLALVSYMMQLCSGRH